MDPQNQTPQSEQQVVQPQTIEVAPSVPQESLWVFWQRIPWKIVVGVMLGFAVVAGGYLLARAFLFKGEQMTQKVSEIVWWGLRLGEEEVAPILAEYEKKSGVHVIYVHQSPQDYRDRLWAALEKGEGPDVFEIHNTWPLMLRGALASVPANIYSSEEYKSTFYPVVVRDMQMGPGYVGVPLEFDGLGLYINTQAFESQDKLPPDTWNEVGELAVFFTKRDTTGRITQAGIPIGRTDNIARWQDILSLMLIQERANLENPTGKSAQTVLSSFVGFSDESDGVWDETLPESLQAFARGEVVMYFGKAVDAGKLRAINQDLKFKVVPVPQLPKTSSNQQDISWASYWVQAVSGESSKKDSAWEFLKYLSSREILNVLANGRFVPARQDLSALFLNDPVFGAYVRQAPYAYSWYLASDTNDGKEGINTQISNEYKTAVEGFLNQQTPVNILTTLASGIGKVLGQYKK